MLSLPRSALTSCWTWSTHQPTQLPRWNSFKGQYVNALSSSDSQAKADMYVLSSR